MLKKSLIEKSLVKKKPFEIVFSFVKSFPIIQVILASCFIAICAQIKIPLYFTPVPFTVQSIAVMLVGAVLGSRKGALAILCYLGQGALGLPVWAGGAGGGIAYLLGPTGGYLMAYVIQVYMIGWFVEKFPQANLFKLVSVMALSICLQLSIGSLWLSRFVGLERCFLLGCFPFILGDAAKAFLVATSIRLCRKKS
ncbi:MAG: biotin transporter BioY [Rhabdochlamydiaceae bacterium]|jgi:biotin transport system substrate-specific component